MYHRMVPFTESELGYVGQVLAGQLDDVESISFEHEGIAVYVLITRNDEDSPTRYLLAAERGADGRITRGSIRLLSENDDGGN